MNPFAVFIRNTILFSVIVFMLTVSVSIAIIKWHDSRAYPKFYTSLVQTKASLKNNDYDTVFIGGSALLRGLDANLFTSVSGKKTYNLALTALAAPTSYEVLMTEHIKNNKKPKNVVIYFSPYAPYRYDNNSFNRVYTVVKYGNWMQIMGEVTPNEIIATAGTLIKQVFKIHIGYDNFYERIKSEIDEGAGYLVNRGEPIDENLVIDRYNEMQSRKNRFDKVLKLRDNLVELDLNVILYASPVTYHDANYERLIEMYGSEISNKIVRLPNTLFSDYTHLTKEGAALNTVRVYEELRDVLK